MNNKFEIKSLAIGVLVGGITVLLLGAGQKINNEVGNLSFRVLGVTRHGEPVDGKQDAVIRLAPAHLTLKRVNADYEDFCKQQNETRELTVVTKVDSKFELPTDTMLVFQAVSLYQLGGRRVDNPTNSTYRPPR